MPRILAPLALLIAAPLFAQDIVPSKPASAKPNPYLHDQTRAEAEAKAATIFAAMDIDHDGFITADEITTFFAARRSGKTSVTLPPPSTLAKSMIDDADTDKDGKVSAEEAKAAADRDFDEVDTNKDGVISPAERMAANQEVMATRKPKPEESGR